VAPLNLPDSAQVRLSRMYPAARYRPTSATVQVPVPRSADSVGAPRIRDLELLQMVADLLLALDGRPKGEFDITGLDPNGPGGRERSDRGIERG
jgi:transcription-repair coupling factor (superfamily II helicase)